LGVLAFSPLFLFCLFLFDASPLTAIYTLSLHDALPIWRFCRQCVERSGWPAGQRDEFGCPRQRSRQCGGRGAGYAGTGFWRRPRSEEHTSELQSRFDLVCRLLLEKKKEE